MAVYKSKIATKDGRQYFFRIKYKDILGVTHDYTSQKYKTLRDATNEETMYKLQVMQKNISTSILTIDQIWKEYYLWKSDKIKRQTLNKIVVQYNKYIKSLGKIKINDFNIKHYQFFKKEMDNSHLSVVYKNKIQGLLASLIRYSNKYYSTSMEILKYFEAFKETDKVKKEMLYFTYEEYLKFIDKVEKFDYKVFYQVLYFLGLRQGECTALSWKDIDIKNKTININKTLTTKLKGETYTITSPKTKSSCRVLPIPNNVLESLKTLYSNAKKYTDFNNNWFVFGNSLPFRETTIQVNKNKACKLANVKQIRIHDFRHSCASLLINKGASIALVSKYLGHSNISITLNTYTHMYKSELESIIQVLDNL